MGFVLSSPTVKADRPLPARYTCDGSGVSPPLAWSGLPSGTVSLALLVEDLDVGASGACRAHWLVYNIPATIHALAEDAARRGLPARALTGTNDWGRTGYGGPCPLAGQHRYVHRLLAVDALLPDLKAPRRAALEAALAGHVVEEARLVATYSRPPTA